MKTKLIPALFLAITLPVLLACLKENRQEQKCPDNLICTEVFITIPVAVVDSQQNPVVLDSHRTTNPSKAAVLVQQRVEAATDFGYPVVTDAEIKLLSLEGDSLLFQGYRGGQEVARGSFFINHDCCHVNKLSGPDTLLIDL